MDLMEDLDPLDNLDLMEGLVLQELGVKQEHRVPRDLMVGAALHLCCSVSQIIIISFILYINLQVR